VQAPPSLSAAATGKWGRPANQSVTHLHCCSPWVATGRSQRHPVQNRLPAVRPQVVRRRRGGMGQRPAAGRETDDAVTAHTPVRNPARGLARGWGTKGGTPVPTYCGERASRRAGQPPPPSSTLAARRSQEPRQNRRRSRVGSAVSCAAASRSALRWAPTAVAVHRTASGGTTVVVVFYRIISYLLMAGGARRRQAFSLMDATASPWRPHASAADGGLFDSCELAVRPPQSRQ